MDIDDVLTKALRDSSNKVEHPEITRLRAENERQAGEIERLRIQLAACGVVALSNTPESAAKARRIHRDHHSASLDDVIRAVDAEMHLRTEVEKLRANQRCAGLEGEETGAPCNTYKLLQAKIDSLRNAAAVFNLAHQFRNYPEECLVRIECSVRELLLVEDALAAKGEHRHCTCHPKDNPPAPCPRRFALSECREAALAAKEK